MLDRTIVCRHPLDPYSVGNCHHNSAALVDIWDLLDCTVFEADTAFAVAYLADQLHWCSSCRLLLHALPCLIEY